MGLRRRPAPLARDAALARLRRLTIVATAVGTALAGGFAALAANAVPGRKAGGATSPATTRPASGGGLRLQPARPRTTTTAPAPSSDDAPAFYSNSGTCLDLYAPGHLIQSAWNTGPTASNTLNGTSMASPHVAGVAALTLESNPTATPEAVASFVLSTATSNRLLYLGTGSPNLLLYSLGTGEVAAPSTKTVAIKSMSGSSVRTGGNWKASAAVTVRDVNSGAAVANATVSGSFSPGGDSRCVTGASGSCTLTSSAIKLNSASSSTLRASGVTGSLMNYDATQNTVTQIVISKP